MRRTETEHLSIGDCSYLVPYGVMEKLYDILDRENIKPTRRRGRVAAEKLFPDLRDPVKRPANYLKGIRCREGLTQAELAKKVGMKQSHISEMERYKRPIGKAAAKRLADVLNADWRNLL